MYNFKIKPIFLTEHYFLMSKYRSAKILMYSVESTQLSKFFRYGRKKLQKIDNKLNNNNKTIYSTNFSHGASRQKLV